MSAPEQTAENVWDALLDAAAAVDEALWRGRDRVEYTGSLELAEIFHTAVVEALHVRSG